MSVIASNVVADGAVVLAGTRDVNFVSAQNTTESTSASSSKKSGSIGSAWQPAIGTVKTTEQGTSQSVTQAGSQVASLGGNVTIEAGERYTQTASKVIAPAGNISIIAKDVQITAGYDTTSSDSQSTFSKTAIGGSINIPIVSAAQGIASLASAAKQAGSDRMSALAAVTAGMQAKDAYNNVTSAGNPAGVKISVSLGTSKSESSTTQSSSTAVGSQLKAGGDVTIVATGGGAGSNITSIGSDISGGGNVTLAADNKINILAAENTSSQHSSNSSSGASIGLSYSFGGTQQGLSLDMAANRASGKADGDSTTYSNSHVSAGSNVNLQSGGDTNIKGGVISANNVVANIGGDLNVQSLQDKVVYDSKQTSAGVGISICIPPACYGASSVSGSLSRAAVNGDFLSVVEQSGIKTGDGGFQLVVHGNTDLIGGVISSSQAAIDQGKNSLATGSLTYTELKNKDVYSADSFAVSGSVSGKFGDQSEAKEGAQKKAADGKAAPSASAGIGQDSGNQSSTTASAISAGALTITDAIKQAATGKTVDQALAGIATGVTTDTAAARAGALTQAWNGEALMKEVQAQTQITQAFSAQAPRAIADFASGQEKSIRDQLKKDPTNVDLQADLAKWGEGGSYRVALHTLSGALSGGVGGALGAMAVAGAADPLNLLQAKIADVLVQQGMSPEAARMASQAVAEAGALGAGALVGGVSGATTALAVDTNNRQLHPVELKWIGQSAKDFAAVLSAKYGEPVSEIAAMRFLTYAGEADVDRDYQSATGLTFGPFYTQEKQMFLDAKQYIAGHANETFVDDIGKTQKLFVAKAGDFYRPLVYSEYKNNVDYRDYYWTVTATNLRPSNPTAQELDVYNSRQTILYASTAKNLLLSAAPSIVGLGLQASRGAVLFPKGSAADGLIPVPEKIGFDESLRNSPPKLNLGSTSEADLGLQTTAGMQGKYSQGSTARLGDANYIDTNGNALPLSNFQSSARSANGVTLDSRLPDPVAGLDYVPKTLSSDNQNIALSHINGYVAEIRLANTVAALENQQVVKFGDAVGTHGADVISVNAITGEVTFWDSKYGSSAVNVGESPTFANEQTRLNATAEAIIAIRNSNLPPSIKEAAITNLQDENFVANTVGAGAAKNSAPRKYCGGKPC